MNAFFLRYSVKASLLLFAAGQAFAADSEEYIGGGSSAPEYDVHEGGKLVEKGAADAHHGGEAAGVHADAAAQHVSAGLPQMDPTWFPSQIFWLAVTFMCLYIIFARKILPEISSTLENRREQIEGDLDTAQAMKEEAEKVHQAYETILDGARKKASGLFIDADEDIKNKANQKLEAFRKRSAKKSADTEQVIAEAKDKAMSDMHSIAAEIASVAAEKIVGISTDLDRAKILVKNIDRKAA
jgi:F-type H+-transporting ATPase subunit b